MSKIEVGDHVRILPRAPGWKEMSPYYRDEMRGYEGRTAAVNSIDGNGHLHFSDIPYIWHPSWVIPITTEDEESVMEKIVSRVAESGQGTGAMIARAAKEGLSMAGAQATSRALVKTVRKRLGGHYPAIFQTPLGQKAEPLILAGMIHAICGMFPGQIPQGENLRANCERVVTAEMKDNGVALLSEVMPLLTELANTVPNLVEGVEG